jgi:hypothetical protein
LPADPSSDRAHGTYDIVLGTHPPNRSAFRDVGGGDPRHQAAIYRVDYDFRHRSTDTTYTVDTREVHPTKDDPGGVLPHHPDIDRFVVTDRTSGHGDPAVEIDRAISDVDRDLARVELHFIHSPSQTGEIVNETHVDVANGSVPYRHPL